MKRRANKFRFMLEGFTSTPNASKKGLVFALSEMHYILEVIVGASHKTMRALQFSFYRMCTTEYTRALDLQ